MEHIYKKRKNYWDKYIIPNIVYIPEQCPICKNNNISIGNLNNVVNPKRMICDHYKCKYITNLRKYSFLSQFPHQPASVIMNIPKLFTMDKKIGMK